ncbi:SDR family NAD(P)-dependent oxidoreductase [Sphingomonas sp. ID0503]|uniref:SDR family NAD(P)-dependent oxidoreductase n=1 Tax=Sphingomonas sp. ID0503 TaxID=3399691 RepID=UPI003AFB78FE
MREALDFTGKQVLVIGGSSGIGNGIARAFRDCGATVHVTGTRAAASDYGPDDLSDMTGLTYSTLDFRQADALAAWRTPFDRLDVLVLCQALAFFKAEEFDPLTFRKVVDVNLATMFDCAERFKPMLAETSGAIVMVSSLAAYRTIPYQPAYTASKTALLGLVRALSMTYIRDGIRVNGIAPGLVKTKMGRNSHPRYDELVDKTVRRIPVKRPAELAEMAGPVLYLASPLASYVIGQTLVIDGGMSLTS